MLTHHTFFYNCYRLTILLSHCLLSAKYDTRIDSPVSENVYDYQNTGTNIPDKLPVQSVDSSNASIIRQLLHDPAKEPENHPTACNLCPFDPPNLCKS